jgi:hypothetical protein
MPIAEPLGQLDSFMRFTRLGVTTVLNIRRIETGKHCHDLFNALIL